MIKLSYILTTYNKLPYLKVVMQLLLQHVQADEEIVVADGGSTDGTVEYLTTLHTEQKIQQFISAKDRGEAHGFNKAILLAKGELIKILSDDDVFYYPAIQTCRAYMLQQPNVDALVGNSGTSESNLFEPPFLNPEMQHEFEKWASGENHTFYCNGLSLMLRKTSLPLLGLFNTGFICVDLEFTIRTACVANYAFARQFIVTRMVNPNSNGHKYAARCKQEQKKLCSTYNYPMPATWLGIPANTVERSKWWKFKNFFNSKWQALQPKDEQALLPTEQIQPKTEMSLEALHAQHLLALQKINTNIPATFITRAI